MAEQANRNNKSDSEQQAVTPTMLSCAQLPPDPDAGLNWAEKETLDRQLLWKLDLILLPWLCFLYLISFLDRTNIGNAKIAHLTQDVPMTTSMYNDTLTIFFVAYATFEALANFLLKRFRPSIFIPCIMITWGLCTVGMGFVTSWSGLMAARWFLGMTEAGLFPGVTYYLSCWYRRRELSLRVAIFFSAAALSGSFGGLLAAAIKNMSGLGGRPGWAWIFILEGLLTVVVGFASFRFVHDFPDSATTTFLTPDERARVIRRLADDNQSSAGAAGEAFRWAYVRAALTDWKTYMWMVVHMGPAMPIYSFSLFLPSIIANLSFTTPDSVVRNQLLTVPPYAAAAFVTILFGYLSDSQGKRARFILMAAVMAITGVSMLMASTNPNVQYSGTFLAAMGLYPAVPVLIAWIANNTEGVYKRGIVLGIAIGWANFNGIVSANIFFDPPRFIQGYIAMLTYIVCLFCCTIVMYMLLKAENNRRRRGERDFWVEGKTAEEIATLGDKRPDFVHTT